MRRLLSRLRSETDGQALVEFAVVVPLIVMVILFALWFYELTFVKLKVQEAARYAAWESTAYPLHDYSGKEYKPDLKLPIPKLPGLGGLGGLAQGKMDELLKDLAGKMPGVTLPSNLDLPIPMPIGAGNPYAMEAAMAVTADTMVRYADMNSATLLPTSNQVLAASWTPALVFITDEQEETVEGGAIANLIFSLLATGFDLVSSMMFKNDNKIAEDLIKTGKGKGAAGAFRTFGSPEWGFNRRGYMRARVAVRVTNEWFNNGVGRFLMPADSVTVLEDHGVLADSWRLNKEGGDNESHSGDNTKPGFADKKPMWKQVERMYLNNSKARGVLKAHVQKFMALMQSALAKSGATASGPSLDDFVKPSVVSKQYADRNGGKVTIKQDNGNGNYDTAPLKDDYEKTFEQRGEHFMGCKESMKLGCTDTLAQDNPFGDYIVRE